MYKDTEKRSRASQWRNDYFHFPLAIKGPQASLSRGGDVAVYVCDLCLWHEPTKLAHSFQSVAVSISIFMALSTFSIP